MKQTAVEWLVEQLPQRMKNYLNDSIALAKAMEKEQIIEANQNKMPFITGEEYYNETFKSE